MRSRQSAPVRTRRLSALGLTIALTVASTAAEARHHGAGGRHNTVAARHHHGLPVDAQNMASMVVDAGTGRTLYASHENELRHPASITKVMTLYLLFEKLDAGQMSLDTRIDVSRHAASMAPTKLGLRPGSTIRVEDAIKAIVTKSANDMAVAVAESIGGDETSFANLMTRKAHALGMSRTVYVNASGLPDDRQLTTARDLTVLGRSIRERFPHYFKFFSTPSFTYAGQTMANHNHLMERFEGMDGIKTGYTRASGFNLLSSVNRGDYHIISVVLGGRSAVSRDNYMASLIESHLEDAAPTRTADIAPPSPVEEPAPTVRPAAYVPDETADRGANLIAPTLSVPPVARPNDRARTPGQGFADRGSPLERARPAFIPGARAEITRPDGRHLAQDGSTSTASDRGGTATPSSIQRIAPLSRQPAVLASLPTPLPVARPDVMAYRARAEDSRIPTASIKAREDEPRPAGAWVIQVGATDAADKAAALLDRAKAEGHGALASARPVTEKVKKGNATLYRARFAGLDTAEATQACRALKRSGFACFAVKD